MNYVHDTPNVTNAPLLRVNKIIKSHMLLTMCSTALSSSSGRVQLTWKLKG